MGLLYVIATPIGNLSDISFRALEMLKTVDILLCEDTRVTGKLLNKYELSLPLESYREQVHERRLNGIIDRLKKGETIGLVSDAGTPGISDPGAWLVKDILKLAPETQIVPIPGPTAAVTALSASGLPIDEFVFLGFPPHKKGRATFFRKLMEHPRTAVIYESPLRIISALTAISEIDSKRPVCLARELTKIYETFYRGTIKEVLAALKPPEIRGEFVVIVGAKK